MVNRLSVVSVQNRWSPDIHYSSVAIDGLTINNWLAKYTDLLTDDSYDYSDRDLDIALDLYDRSETRAVWQYLGLPANKTVTYVPLLVCPDNMDLIGTVRVVEQRYDEKFVYWERFGSLMGYIHEQDPNSIEWFPNVPKLTFKQDNFMEVFSKLNLEIVQKIKDMEGKVLDIPFPAKPVRRGW